VQDLFILRSAASRADIQATALHLRRSTRALQKRLRRLLLAVPCRVQPGAPSRTWEASASVSEAVAAAHTATHSDLPLNLRVSLLEVLVPSSTPAVASGPDDSSSEPVPEGELEKRGTVLPEGQQPPAAMQGASPPATEPKKRRRKRKVCPATGAAEVAAGGQPKAKRKRAASTGPATKRRATSPLASAVAALLGRQGLDQGASATALTCLGSTPRSGPALALAGHLPSQLEHCSREQLHSLMQEAGLTAEQVAGITAAGGQDKDQQQIQLAAVTGSCVHAWEVKRALACATLPSTTLRYLALLRLLPLGPAGLTLESIRAAHRQLALVLHPDKQPDCAVANTNTILLAGMEVPVPEVTASQVNDAWCHLQEARDALLTIVSSPCC
jgi:hypothetical protein